MCSSRKNPYPPHGRSLEIPGSRGILEAKFLEAMYENKLEFPWGEGVQHKKNLPLGGVWLLSGTAQYCFVLFSLTRNLTPHSPSLSNQVYDTGRYNIVEPRIS